MFDIFVSISILGFIYWLIVRGALFRGLCWIFSVYGMSEALNHIDALKTSPLTIFSHPVQWSIVISFTIVLLAIATTKIKERKYND